VVLGARVQRDPAHRWLDAVHPQKLAGIRTEPPPSLPSENGPIPVATAAPVPAEEPPEVRSRFQGLRVGSASGVCPVPE
jgi:hypothetical protein